VLTSRGRSLLLEDPQTGGGGRLWSEKRQGSKALVLLDNLPIARTQSSPKEGREPSWERGEMQTTVDEGKKCPWLPPGTVHEKGRRDQKERRLPAADICFRILGIHVTIDRKKKNNRGRKEDEPAGALLKTPILYRARGYTTYCLESTQRIEEKRWDPIAPFSVLVPWVPLLGTGSSWLARSSCSERGPTRQEGRLLGVQTAAPGLRPKTGRERFRPATSRIEMAATTWTI